MNSYIPGIVGAAAVIGVMESILPKSNKAGAYLKLVTSLCLLCLVLRPVGAFLDALPSRLSVGLDGIMGDEDEQAEYRAILEGEVLAVVREALAEELSHRLAERFSVTDCEIGTSLTRVDGAYALDRVVITLTGRDIFKNPHAIESYVTEQFGCECTVVIG